MDTNFKPMTPDEFDVSKVEFTKLRKLDNGALTMYLNYDGGQPIYLKTPELDLPFDGKYWPDNDTTGKWAIKANLKGDKCSSMVQKMKEMDDRIKEEALKNSVAWFKKRNLSAETIDSLYNSMIKESLDPETGDPDGRFPPSFSFKVVKRNDNVTCKIYTDKSDEYNTSNPDGEDYVSVDDLVKKGTKVKLLIRCNGVWLANGKFGCTWRAEQMKVKPAANFDEYAFEDSEDEEVEKIDENFVESSEDESEDEDKSPKKNRKVNKVK